MRLPFQTHKARRDRVSYVFFSSALANAFLWKNPHIRFMKQELTFAVVLLAIGCLLWGSGSKAISPAQQANKPIIDPSQVASSGRFDTRHSVIQASFQQSTVTEGQIPVQPQLAQLSQPQIAPTAQSNQSNSQAKNPAPLPSTNGYRHATSNLASIELLAQAAREAADAQPFGSKLNLKARVFEQDVIASGDYYQMGQGSHKTKLELTFDQMPGSPKLLQLCDGRFVYTIHSTGDTNGGVGNVTPQQQSLEFVDLLRVKEAAAEARAGNLDRFSPTGWVATGGIASLLQHLASGFNLGQPESLDRNSDQILIRGGWDENALRGIVFDLDNRTKLGSPIQWDQVPKHLPHAIELVLTRNANRTYFPSQITFLRFGTKDDQATIEPSISLTFSPPKPLLNLSDGFFVIDSSNLEPTDATDRYIARIKSFRKIRRQQSSVEQVATEQEPSLDILTK